jgi:hypothetical protein
MVSLIGWLVVVLVVVVIAAVAFVVVRAQRRTGRVIATRKTKQ